MNITDVNKHVKAAPKRFRVGRGAGSGAGKTSGRGMKGAGARAGEASLRGFIGGQSPLRARLPKRGFNNAAFKTQYLPVNLDFLNEKFSDGAVVNLQTLAEAGVNLRRGHVVKILGTGDLAKKLTVNAHAFSKTAETKIKNAGGAVAIITVVKEIREKTGKRAKGVAKK
jgi:large subunit ribosomal protein L15